MTIVLKSNSMYQIRFAFPLNSSSRTFNFLCVQRIGFVHFEELAYKTSASLFMLRKHLNNLNMSSYTRPIPRRNYLDDNENYNHQPESHTRAAKKFFLMISKVCVNQRILIQKKMCLMN